jgi:hypothetical protein
VINTLPAVITDAFIDLIVGGQQKEASNKSGWNKSTSREFYMDVCHLIEKAQSSRENGHMEPMVTVAEFQKSIILAFTDTAEPGDRAIVWSTIPSRMNRYIGQAKTFQIAHLDQVAPIGATTVPQVSHPIADRYARFHFGTEQLEVLKGLKGRCDFGSKITSPRGGRNYLDLIFAKLMFHLLEKHLRGGPDKVLVGFPPRSVLEETELLSGYSYTIFFWEAKIQPDNYFKNFMRKINGEFKGATKWSSENWTRFGLGENAFHNIDRENWDKMIKDDGNNLLVGEIAPFWTVGYQGDAQSAAVRSNNWKIAMQLFKDGGVVTRDFVERLVDIRSLWHKTHLKFTFQIGDESLEDLMDRLTPFLPIHKERNQMNKYLFE